MKCRAALGLIAILILGGLGTGFTRREAGRRARLEAWVRFLSDDQLEGRATPSRGLDVAALWLSAKLREAGWEPAFDNGSYLQKYEIDSYKPSEARYGITINGRALRSGEFLLSAPGISPHALDTGRRILFAGRGLDLPERGAADYEGLQLEGSAALIVQGSPFAPSLDPLAADQLLGRSVSAAAHGAALTIVVAPDLSAEASDQDVGFVRSLGASEVSFLPGLRERASAFGALLMISDEAYERVIAPTARVSLASLRRDPSRLLGTRLGNIDVTIEATPRKASASNVGAILRGSDPLLKDEWIVLTAHYDHLGQSTDATLKDRIYNGADDDASGSAALIELAHSLAVAPHKRSILLLFDSGEELGLLGSAWFVEHSPIPLSKVIVDVNLDMIGRSNGEIEAATYGAADLYRAIHSQERRDMRVVPDRHPQWRTVYLSDDYQFARRGIPSVEFFTGLHSDYHQTSDEADRVHFPELTAAVDLIERLTSHYADGAPRPIAQWPEWLVQRHE